MKRLCKSSKDLENQERTLKNYENHDKTFKNHEIHDKKYIKENKRNVLGDHPEQIKK